MYRIIMIYVFKKIKILFYGYFKDFSIINFLCVFCPHNLNFLDPFLIIYTLNDDNSSIIWRAAPETMLSRSGGANIAAQCSKLFSSSFMKANNIPLVGAYQIEDTSLTVQSSNVNYALTLVFSSHTKSG